MCDSYTISEYRLQQLLVDAFVQGWWDGVYDKPDARKFIVAKELIRDIAMEKNLLFDRRKLIDTRLCVFIADVNHTKQIKFEGGNNV